MQQAAGHHEQVPDAVPVAKALVVGVEDDPDRIEHATGHQPGEARAAERCEQRLDRHQHDPAHHRIDDDRQHARFRAWLDLLQHADDGQAPDDAEQPPAPAAAQGHEAEGRVAAGDQQVDRQMIELAHDPLRPASHAVVERRGAVQQHQGETVDRHADDPRHVAAHGRQDQQPDAADHRQHAAGQVRPGVELFPVIHRCSVSISRPLRNVGEAGKTRQKQVRKRSLGVLNEHSEPVFNAVLPTQVVFQRPASCRSVRQTPSWPGWWPPESGSGGCSLPVRR